MKSKLTSPEIALATPKAFPRSRVLPSTRWLVQRALVILFSLVMLGSSAITASMARIDSFAMSVAGNSWDLVGWEVGAIAEKVNAFFKKPADHPSAGVLEVVEVKDYLARASRMGEIERILARRASGSATGESSESDEQLLEELSGLRSTQEEVRPRIEQILERQVGGELTKDSFSAPGFRVWPPVSFSFVEPPKKLVVSSRDKIETIYSQMLDAAITVPEMEAAEAKIGAEGNAVGYVTDIGGLGAFPTMVVDRASLRWVLSTVAHEWTHNYLVFHPLGWNYFKNQDMTTLNESVAEIVGNEVGDRALAQYYPELVPSPAVDAVPGAEEAPKFDFQREMQITRQEVDRLLELGDVDGAESYMEERRQIFVENDYPLRVLNQAYFAFHGSYGTSPASTSPIGPKLERLRSLMPDLKTFLETVQRFTSVEDLDAALVEWE